MSDFLDNMQGEGYEDISINDVSVPFLRILQKLLPQCDEGQEEYNKEAKPGMFLNSLTGELYGVSCKVIPVKYEKSWLEWKPNRGGFVGSHLPKSIQVDTSDYSAWKRVDNGNDITETVNYYCILPDYPEAGLIVLSLTSSALKHAKAWNNQIMTTRLKNGAKAPFFSSVWELSTKLNKNDQGSWYTIGLGSSPAIKRERFITEDEYTTLISPARVDVEKLIGKVHTSLETGVDEVKSLPLTGVDKVEY